ncbi:MAG TPA: metallophosphoesterase [Polyangiaceae bacterium]|nr:metallophosphoesterase [Polyangiaceae bacterium]
MTRAVQLATFIGIALGLLGAIHFYVWLRLVADPAPPPVGRRLLTGAFVALYLAIPATFYVSRARDIGARRLLAMPGYVWMGVVFILFMLFASVDIVRLAGAALQRLAGETPPSDPARRIAVARLFAFAVASVGGGATLAALRSGLGPVHVKEVRVRLERLPRQLDGTTIVQLSDVHVGPTIGRSFVERIVDQVNALSPDLVAITGDLVDGSVSELADQVAPIAELKSRYGTYFVTGNHEFYSGRESWCRKLRSLGIQVLSNERVSIGEGAASFDLAGVEDYNATRFGIASDVGKAVEGRDPNRELVLLAHQPRSAFAADQHGVGLQLSGHTHGGQIWPWSYFVYLQQPVVAGLSRIGRTLVYVSRGTGYWGPPMRLRAPAEITRIVLESA